MISKNIAYVYKHDLMSLFRKTNKIRWLIDKGIDSLESEVKMVAHVKDNVCINMSIYLRPAYFITNL